MLSSVCCFAQQAEFSFEDDTHRFPRTKEGPTLSHTYYFTNTGDTPLFITDYKVSCSCTHAKFPMKPVPPGARDSIVVTFDTKMKIGYQDRLINIFSNASNNPTPIRFKVFVAKNKD